MSTNFNPLITSSDINSFSLFSTEAPEVAVEEKKTEVAEEQPLKEVLSLFWFVVEFVNQLIELRFGAKTLDNRIIFIGFGLCFQAEAVKEVVTEEKTESNSAEQSSDSTSADEKPVDKSEENTNGSTTTTTTTDALPSDTNGGQLYWIFAFIYKT